MRVTNHARRRFLLHINAACDPVHGVCKMWHTGKDASDDDLQMYYVNRYEGCEYRVGSFEGSSAVLVARDLYIITVIPAFRLI